MSKINDIDQQIERLKEKKKQLETLQAVTLIKQLQGILKDAFSPELVTHLVTEIWTKATPAQKEDWRKKAHSFRTTPKTQPHDRNSEGHPKNHAAA